MFNNAYQGPSGAPCHITIILFALKEPSMSLFEIGYCKQFFKTYQLGFCGSMNSIFHLADHMCLSHFMERHLGKKQ